MNREIASFLLPNAANPIEVLFFYGILIAAVGSIIWVLVAAWPRSWQKRWAGGTAQDTLRVEHGSINDLSDAVATPAEKVVDALPGMLLIFGLLGTFLGLGLALDKASGILQNAGDAVNGMGNTMQDLTRMMEGLGTKFKTSTWGIIAFIAMKAAASAIGFENRRLLWCINKMKGQIDQAKQHHASREEIESSRQQAAMQTLSEHIAKAVAQQTAALLGASTDLRTLAEQEAAKQSEFRTALVARTSTGFQELKEVATALVASSEIHATTSKSTLLSLVRLEQATTQSGKVLTAFADRSLENTEHEAVRQSEFRTELFARTAIGFQELKEVAIALLASSDTHATTSKSMLTSLVGLEQASSQSSKVLATFIDRSLENLDALQKSGETMGDAASGMAAAARGLGSTVTALNTEIGVVLGSVKNDLNTAITAMNDDFRANLSQMGTQLGGATDALASVMEKVKSDLGDTIELMSKDFKANTLDMSKSLGSATDNISVAIGTLAQSVDGTMLKVSGVMENSSDIQKRTNAQFTTTSETLNENIQSMTMLVEKLTGNITSGLKAVSESGQRMVSLDKRYAAFTDSLELVAKVPDELQKSTLAATRTADGISTLHEGLAGLSAKLAEIGNSLNSLEIVATIPGHLLEATQAAGKTADGVAALHGSLGELNARVASIGVSMQARTRAESAVTVDEE